jgi:hypothetical protein
LFCRNYFFSIPNHNLPFLSSDPSVQIRFAGAWEDGLWCSNENLTQNCNTGAEFA